MKKFLVSIVAIATVLVCSSTAFAAEVGESDEVPGTSSGIVADDDAVAPGTSSGETNVPTGVVLTVVPTALAAGALAVSGIVLKKKNK